MNMVLADIITKYIEENSEIGKWTDDTELADCEHKYICNPALPQNIELWDYEIKNSEAVVSYNEVKLDILVEALLHVSITGIDLEEGDEITKHFRIETILDFDQFKIKHVGVLAED